MRRNKGFVEFIMILAVIVFLLYVLPLVILLGFKDDIKELAASSQKPLEVTAPADMNDIGNGSLTQVSEEGRDVYSFKYIADTPSGLKEKEMRFNWKVVQVELPNKKKAFRLEMEEVGK
jgi:hypothetical protein